MPYQYPGDPAVVKIFVLICHEGGNAICMKATSNVAIYANNPDLKAGVVHFEVGSVPFFSEETAVQPDNPHPIAHVDISRCQANGSFKVLGQMPADFIERLRAAINASITIKPARKENFLKRL
jgi:hypothetical protein